MALNDLAFAFQFGIKALDLYNDYPALKLKSKLCDSIPIQLFSRTLKNLTNATNCDGISADLIYSGRQSNKFQLTGALRVV